VRGALQARLTYATLESTERVTRLANAIWRAAFSDGTLTAVKLGATRIEFRRTGWSGHHPVICRFGMHALRALYEATGASQARLEIGACVAEGGADCHAVVSW
jgi:hypothetical protein